MCRQVRDASTKANQATVAYPPAPAAHPPAFQPVLVPIPATSSATVPTFAAAAATTTGPTRSFWSPTAVVTTIITAASGADIDQIARCRPSSTSRAVGRGRSVGSRHASAAARTEVTTRNERVRAATATLKSANERHASPDPEAETSAIGHSNSPPPVAESVAPTRTADRRRRIVASASSRSASTLGNPQRSDPATNPARPVQPTAMIQNDSASDTCRSLAWLRTVPNDPRPRQGYTEGMFVLNVEMS